MKSIIFSQIYEVLVRFNVHETAILLVNQLAALESL